MEDFFKYLRRPCTRVISKDGQNRKTENQYLIVASAFKLKIFTVFKLFWAMNVFSFFSSELQTPKHLEHQLN